MIENWFGLSHLGFLPAKCVQKLPKDCPFSGLETIAEVLPMLNRMSLLNAAISKLDLPPLDATKQLDEGEQRRLYVILAMIIHSLVHGSKAKWELLESDESASELVMNCGKVIIQYVKSRSGEFQNNKLPPYNRIPYN